MNRTFFITGISTEVGKTIASAILTECLEADYWKPIQAGELHFTDTHKVRQLISNAKTQIHPSYSELQTPMSPHAAAAIDGVSILSKNVKRPKTDNHLVIEGAGGLLVPLNDKETIANLILPTDHVIIVSRHYLGSINHTLLTVEALQNKGLKIFGIIFSGDSNPTTESIISEMSQLPILGRIGEEPYFDQNVIKEYAQIFSEKIKARFEAQ